MDCIYIGGLQVQDWKYRFDNSILVFRFDLFVCLFVLLFIYFYENQKCDQMQNSTNCKAAFKKLICFPLVDTTIRVIILHLFFFFFKLYPTSRMEVTSLCVSSCHRFSHTLLQYSRIFPAN